MNLEVTHRSELELLTCTTPTKELKYRVFQIYGQKYIKILESTSRPDSGSEVFGANIPRNIDIVTLFKFFAVCGEIYQLRLLMDFSGFNRGKCFVQYQDVKASREAICCLHNEFIGENKIVVKLSLNNNQLVLKSIPRWVVEGEVREAIADLMGEGLIGCSLKRSRHPLKQYCLCRYKDHQFAALAHKKAWPFVNVLGAMVDVHWAVPVELRHNERLYFTNFSPNTTKADFFEALINVIDLRTLIQFRIFQFCGTITFNSLYSLLIAEIALRNFIVKGCRIHFSREPYPMDRYSTRRFSYYKESLIVEQSSPRLPASFYGPYAFPPQFPPQPLPFPANAAMFLPHQQFHNLPPYSFYNSTFLEQVVYAMNVERVTAQRP